MIHVQNIRESNFRLFVSCLPDIISWMFAMYRIHYARWLAVHNGELLSLVVENREIFEKFAGGYFIISKSKGTFSKLVIYHAQEKNSKLVKVGGSTIGILENEANLVKRAAAGPMISYMLKTVALFEKKPNKGYDHYEHTKLLHSKR